MHCLNLTVSCFLHLALRKDSPALVASKVGNNRVEFYGVFAKHSVYLALFRNKGKVVVHGVLAVPKAELLAGSNYFSRSKCADTKEGLKKFRPSSPNKTVKAKDFSLAHSKGNVL